MHHWEQPGSISSPLLAASSKQISLSFLQALQSPFISPGTEIVSIQKRVCFYSWLEIYRFACPCFHIRVGSFSGLACKTVVCFPKLETLHAGRKPARNASFSTGDSANQPTRSTRHLCERVVPGKCRSWGSFAPKCCLSQNAAGPNSFLCLETCL